MCVTQRKYNKDYYSNRYFLNDSSKAFGAVTLIHIYEDNLITVSVVDMWL